MYSWIIENKEFLKIIYSLIVVFICFVIVLRTDKLFRLSLHNGIRYFRNAFFFYGIGFAIRYFLGALILYGYLSSEYSSLVNIFFEFFLIMGGFFLLYSLLWKKFEGKKEHITSLIHTKISIFYLMAIVIVFLDYIWQTYYFMFLSQIILFLCATIISYSNRVKKGKQHNFLNLYFIAMLVSFIAWSLNFVAAIYFNWNYFVLINVYTLNVFVFVLFLYGVIKVTKIK